MKKLRLYAGVCELKGIKGYQQKFSYSINWMNFLLSNCLEKFLVLPPSLHCILDH